MYFYNNYKRLLNGTLYPVTGWDNFIGSLSTDFWEGTHYVYLQAEIQPAPSATQEERKRLFDFCTHWVQQWTNKFGTKTNSRDHQVFSLNHFTIGGHFSLGKQSVFVIHKLVNELSEVMKQNRPDQATIEIRYKGEIFIETGTGEQNRADEIMEEIRQRNEDERWMKD